jgi:hypothetical protein
VEFVEWELYPSSRREEVSSLFTRRDDARRWLVEAREYLEKSWTTQG